VSINKARIGKPPGVLQDCWRHRCVSDVIGTGDSRCQQVTSSRAERSGHRTSAGAFAQTGAYMGREMHVCDVRTDGSDNPRVRITNGLSEGDSRHGEIIVVSPWQRREPRRVAVTADKTRRGTAIVTTLDLVSYEMSWLTSGAETLLTPLDSLSRQRGPCQAMIHSWKCTHTHNTALEFAETVAAILPEHHGGIVRRIAAVSRCDGHSDAISRNCGQALRARLYNLARYQRWTPLIQLYLYNSYINFERYDIYKVEVNKSILYKAKQL